MEHKIYKVYEEEDFFRLTTGIKVAQCMRTDTSTDTKDEADILGKLEDLSVSEKLFCSFCNASFEDQVQQRQHYKLDWHRYNLKKRLFDKKPVTEDNFSQLADLDDVSSISGSESESEDETDTDVSAGEASKPGLAKRQNAILASRHTKVFFENADGKIFSVYRCLLHSKKDVPEKDEQFVPLALKVVSSTKWVIVMLGGGHFAAAIFDGPNVVVHKTFHCYTVRKGQGGTQSARDGRSGGGHPKSAGASLRRYNEAALTQHVQDIMTTWAGDLATCDLVFYRASGHNVAVLFSGRSPPLAKTDPRLRTIPFPTRRATFSEVKRVQDVLASLEVYGSADAFQTSFPISPRKKLIRPAEEGLAKDGNDLGVTPASDTSVSDSAMGIDSPGSNQPRSPRGIVDRAKARKSPVRPLPDIVADLAGSSSDSGDDLEIGDEGLNVSFLDTEIEFGESLQEYEDTVSQGVKNRRKKGPKKKKIKEKTERVVETRTEILALRRKLKAACRLGDAKLLESSLSIVGSKQASDATGVVGDVSRDADVPAGAVHKGVEEQGGKVSMDDLLKCLNDSVDEKENRLLHLAAEGGHVEILRLLMGAGSDPSVKNKKGQPPYVLSVDKETRNAFRRFLGEFPDKYDYEKSQIPGALTDDLLKEQTEKKRLLKKVKREKVKEKKKEEELKKGDQLERERFLNLTDREKRALAAERRLLTEATRGGSAKPVVSRCFLCGVDISGKVPFEYDIHRFCTIVCLKSHRMMNKPKQVP